ncbi:hypothetical protein IJ670_06200 [bacterium]|nr:hypothetical protein [bacterium]
MYDNEYFVVDMASCTTTGEIINNLSLALETLNYSSKKIVLKLNNAHLNQSQLLSIQSLITSWGCTLDTIETLNPETKEVAENMNIFVQKPIEQLVQNKYPEDVTVDLKASDVAIKEATQDRFEADLDIIKREQKALDETINTNEVNLIEEKEKNDFEVEFKTKNKDFFDDLTKRNNTDDNDISTNNIKNSIGVYKKAYDVSDDKVWEDVDFYESPTNEPVVTDTKETTYINQTLRSGQILEAEGNVVIIGDCHSGSEIRAGGDITIWGVLSGIAHAGSKGNTKSKIRALKMNAVQLRIGNCYSRRPDDTNIPYIIRSSVFTPEEARVVDGEIMLFKVNQN